jgi:hypothetical protein
MAHAGMNLQAMLPDLSTYMIGLPCMAIYYIYVGMDITLFLAVIHFPHLQFGLPLFCKLGSARGDMHNSSGLRVYHESDKRFTPIHADVSVRWSIAKLFVLCYTSQHGHHGLISWCGSCLVIHMHRPPIRATDEFWTSVAFAVFHPKAILVETASRWDWTTCCGINDLMEQRKCVCACRCRGSANRLHEQKLPWLHIERACETDTDPRLGGFVLKISIHPSLRI